MLSTVTTTASPKRPRCRRKPVSTVAPAVDHRAVLACRLDRNADVLLSRHCHLAAERLSLRAQALRETGP